MLWVLRAKGIAHARSDVGSHICKSNEKWGKFKTSKSYIKLVTKISFVTYFEGHATSLWFQSEVSAQLPFK